METEDTEKLVQQLATGFEVLQDEYQKLHGQHEALERKLHTAREQYNELAKLYGQDCTSTPPLSLASSPKPSNMEVATAPSIPELLERQGSAEVANRIRQAQVALQTLRSNRKRPGTVRIWSGPSADRPEAANSSLMPSISESPLEQDFTVEGVPSKLGCPFASMANKKLSSHAASIVSRYNHRNSPVVGGSRTGVISEAASGVSRIDGKESLSRLESRRNSGLPDPIKAEICGLSAHSAAPEHPLPIPMPVDAEQQAEAGVCPIRFLDQHSPEEVATYFEKHKHELPRSHEVCVKRYQSNEDQIRELDAKYGNLVSMIQGLGQKHQPMLPLEPIEDEDAAVQAERDKAKIASWARSVSGQATGVVPDGKAEEEDEERQPHFDRPMRDIRVGESPSRPWGYQVPVSYERSFGDGHSGRVSTFAPTDLDRKPSERSEPERPTVEAKPPAAAGKCPFGFDKLPAAAKPAAAIDDPVGASPETASKSHVDDAFQNTGGPIPKHKQRQNFTGGLQTDPSPAAAIDAREENKAQPRIVISGPVFIGYSAEDAAKVMRDFGLGGTR